MSEIRALVVSVAAGAGVCLLTLGPIWLIGNALEALGVDLDIFNTGALIAAIGAVAGAYLFAKRVHQRLRPAGMNPALRRPLVFVIGFAATTLVVILMLLDEESMFLIGVAIFTCALIVLMATWFVGGGVGTVQRTTVRWEGADRRALIVPTDRWTVGTVYFLLYATIGAFVFVGVMAVFEYSTEQWVHIALAVSVGVGALLASLPFALGERLVLLTNGVLLRQGPLVRFVPWTSVAAIGRYVSQTSRGIGIEFLRVQLRPGHRLQSNWRPWSRQTLMVPTFFFSMESDQLLTLMRKTWRDPRTVDRPAPSDDRHGLGVREAGPVGTRRWRGAPYQAVRNALDLVADGDVEFAIFHADDDQDGYVQVVADGEGRLRAEAVLNTYLAPEAHLGDRAAARLADLGWDVTADEPADFAITLRVESQGEIEEAAGGLLDVLCDVYGLAATRSPGLELG